MKMTWKGFLKGYVKSLSGSRTESIRKLASVAAHDAPRVAEPLFFLASCEGKMDFLLEAAHGTWMQEDYENLSRVIVGAHFDPFDLSNDERFPIRYRKVADAYKWEIQGERRALAVVKGAIRVRCLGMLEELDMSVYVLARILRLDPSNLSGFLRRGELHRLGYRRACDVEDRMKRLVGTRLS